jgi:hypothetical protein
MNMTSRGVAAMLALTLIRGCAMPPVQGDGAGGEDMVRMVRLKASHTEFIRIPARRFDQARYEKYRAFLGPDRLEVVSLSQFEANAARYVLPAIEVNDYPDVDIVAGIREFVRRYPDAPIGLTWNGGVASNLDDVEYAAKIHAEYRAAPEDYAAAGVRDPLTDPLHPERHLNPLLSRGGGTMTSVGTGATLVYGRIRWIENGKERDSYKPPPLILRAKLELARNGDTKQYGIEIRDNGTFVANMAPGRYLIHRVRGHEMGPFDPRPAWGFIVPDKGGHACLGSLVVEASSKTVLLSRHLSGGAIRVDDDCEQIRARIDELKAISPPQAHSAIAHTGYFVRPDAVPGRPMEGPMGAMLHGAIILLNAYQ